MLAGIFMALNELFIGTAFRIAPIAYVGSLKRLSIVFTVLLSWWILGETRAKRRLGPAIVVTLGAILLATDGSMTRLINIFVTALR